MRPTDHPTWCRCQRCEAEDRQQERDALRGIPLEEDPAIEAEIGQPPRRIVEPSDIKRELAEKRMRAEEPAERAALGYFP